MVRRIRQELVAKGCPASTESDLRGDLVDHVHSRGQTCLDRVLREDALGERVQGPDGGPVKLLECPPASGAGRAVGVRFCVSLELLSQPVPQLGRGLVGKGDGGDRVQLEFT